MDKFTTTAKVVPIEQIVPNSYNPNKQTDFIYQKEKESIKKHGFIDPLLVRRVTGGKYEIIDGEHRWKAAKELEYKELKVEDIGEIDDFDAMTLTLVMNNTRGQDDVLQRAKLLQDIPDSQLGLLPFEAEQIKEERDLLKFDFENLKKEARALVDSSDKRTMCFNLTQGQYDVLNLALKLTKKQDTKALLEILKQYLELRVDISEFENIFE